MDYAKRAAEMVITAPSIMGNRRGWLKVPGTDRGGVAFDVGDQHVDLAVADVRAMLTAELQAAHDAGVAEAGDVREVLADLLSAINEDQEALVSYFADVGAEHERDCPEDDTCECELIVAMHKAHKRLAGAVHDATKLLEEGR